MLSINNQTKMKDLFRINVTASVNPQYVFDVYRWWTCADLSRSLRAVRVKVPEAPKVLLLFTAGNGCANAGNEFPMTGYSKDDGISKKDWVNSFVVSGRPMPLRDCNLPFSLQ